MHLLPPGGLISAANGRQWLEGGLDGARSTSCLDGGVDCVLLELDFPFTFWSSERQFPRFLLSCGFTGVDAHGFQ